MKRTFAIAGFILALAGCSEFAQRRVGSARSLDGPPKAEPTLAISNTPTKPIPLENPIQQTAFLPETTSTPQPGDANPLLHLQALRLLHQRAGERLKGMDAYTFRLRRRETIDAKQSPEELVHVNVRREPFSVHLKWIGPEGKGREAIYVHGKFKDEIQILPSTSDIGPFSALGIRFSIAPNDPKARARSRYPITDVGLATIVDRFGQALSADKAGGGMKYLGKLKRPEFETEVEGVSQAVAPGVDAALPKGGERWWYFDATSGLPVLVIAHHANAEVEYFCHDQIQPARLGDDDFNPDRVWRK